jgi:23S rRNA pseudouridine2605 synthase
MELRLQKVIAQAGIASRRKAEQLIENGLVKVDGKIILEQGVKVDLDKNKIEVEGKLLKPNRKVHTIMYALYKPRNCLTTLDDPRGRETIVRYFPDIKNRLFPVGRLDYDSEGLVLLTNDGDLAHNITHPTKHIWKKYFVKIKGKISQAEIKKLLPGPKIEGRKRQPVRIRLLHYINEKSWLVVSLQEGIKHHIKKMFKEIGYNVQKIKRFQIGNLTLEEMKPGETRLITKDELDELISLLNGTS